MYELVSDNILAHKNGASFIYKLPTFNTSLGTDSAKKSANELIVKIIYKMGMKGELLILPRRELVKNFVDFHYTVDPENELQNDYIKELTKLLRSKNMQEYDTYIAFNESDMKQGKQKWLFSNGFDADLSNSRRDSLIKLGSLYLELLQETNKQIRAVNPDELQMICQYLKFSIRNVTNDFVFEYTPRNIKSFSESRNGTVTEMNSMYIQASEFPQDLSSSIKLIEGIKRFNFPVDIVIKFDVDLKNIKLEKEMRQAKRTFLEANKKYKRDTQDSEGLHEYKEKAKIAQKAQKEMQRADSAIIQMQFNIRLSTNKKEFDILATRYKSLKKCFERSRISTVSCLGKQHIMHDNFQLGDLSHGENIHSFSKTYTEKLSLLSDSKIGLPAVPTSKVACYEVMSNKPVLIDDYEPLRGKTAKTQSTIAYVGSSGSGKSQLVNNHLMNNVIMNGAKALVIDPKGDREDFFKGEQLIDSYTELKIGSDLKYKGLMDLYDKDNINESKLKIIDYVKLLYKLAEKTHEYELATVGKFLDEYYLEDVKKHCMLGFMKFVQETYITEEIKKNDNEKVATSLLTLLQAFENLPFSNLFYGSEDTKKISFESSLTIIILESIDDKENNDTIKKQLFNHVFLHITTFVKDFLRTIEKNTPSEIVIEEVEYLNEQTSIGLEDEVARLARSWGTVFRYVLQNPSGISDATKNNTGTWFIGRCENNAEFKIITDFFELEPRSVGFLRTSNNDEGMPEAHRYNFLLVDSNNRKSRVKAHFLPMFEKMFDTHVEEARDEKIK